MKKFIQVISFALAALLLVVGAAALPAGAADHLDAPGLTPPGGDLALDITDVYAFKSPQCADCTVMVMGVNGLTAPGINAPFADDAIYRLHIDTNGDANDELRFNLRFSDDNSQDMQPMSVRLNNRGETTVLIDKREGRSTPIGMAPIINEAHGIKVFAGMADDPFFFDLPAFLNLDFCPSDPAADTFAGTNIAAIVLEVPNHLFDSSNIGVWATTGRDNEQVDRMGRPAINTVFIPNNPLEPDGPSKKTKFNESHPKRDQERFRDEIVNTLQIFYDDDSAVQGLADFLLPDILTINLDEATAFPNGRALADDVIDVELGLLTNGAITSDCVDANDLPFANTFPYLAPAQQ